MRRGDAREEMSRPLLAGRDLMLYLLSYHCSTSAQLAWGLSEPARLAGYAVALVVAGLAGERLSPLLQRSDRRALARLRLVGGLAYALLAALGLVAVLSATDSALVGGGCGCCRRSSSGSCCSPPSTEANAVPSSTATCS